MEDRFQFSAQLYHSLLQMQVLLQERLDNLRMTLSFRRTCGAEAIALLLNAHICFSCVKNFSIHCKEQNWLTGVYRLVVAGIFDDRQSWENRDISHTPHFAETIISKREHFSITIRHIASHIQCLLKEEGIENEFHGCSC